MRKLSEIINVFHFCLVAVSGLVYAGIEAGGD